MKFTPYLLLALAVDGIQLWLTPLIIAGGLGIWLDGALDVTMLAILSWRRGFHWAYLPTFAAELVPGVGLIPLWTTAVLLTEKQVSKRSRTEKPADATTGKEPRQVQPEAPKQDSP